MSSRAARTSCWVLAAITAGALVAQGVRAEEITVFAARSLGTALDEVGAAWAASTGGRAKISYGITLALARQIDAGASVDVFISGDPDWMDYLDGRGVMKSATIVTLLGNRLVLVAPARSEVAIEIAPGFDLAGLLGDSRLVMPDLETLPAGRYGKQALRALGVWDHVAEQVTQTESMHAATTLVAAGEAALGIVYLTEAVADPGLRIVDTFPAETHAPIVYKAGETAEAADGDAASFLAFLQTHTAAGLFEAKGFTVLAPVREN
jgi:molybdate transport system substrate-binding protein